MHTPRAVTLSILAALLVMTIGVPPAVAKPSQVGTVSFVKASTQSLTLRWHSVSGAKSYQIFRSTHPNMAGAKIVSTPRKPWATVSGLATGKVYCFQVRARAGSSVGMRSAHTCKPTIRARAPLSGPAYSVMTFNACSDVCGRWSSRLPAALKMIKARHPDVLATQEAAYWKSPPSGYSQAVYYRAKRLFYKSSRFKVATASGKRRVGAITLSTSRFAVWAELVNRSTGKHIIFVSAHTTPELKAYAKRGREITNLLTRMKQINTAGRTVVYAGDFNSNKNRGTYSEATGFGSQDTVGRTFAKAGYYDAYDLAASLKRPNWNSAAGFRRVPKVSRTWGDHVDHVYVVPQKARVWRWMNAALYSGSRYATPMPSDHSPVQVDLYLP